MNPRRYVQVALLLLAIIALGACPEETAAPEDLEDVDDFTVVMRHNTAAGGHPMHIYVQDYEQRQPGTLMNGGGTTRSFTVSNSSVCDHLNDDKCSLTFIAARDPSAAVPYSTDVLCEWPAATTPASVEVRWTGNALECIGWSRVRVSHPVTVHLVNEKNHYGPSGTDADLHMPVAFRGEQFPCCLVTKNGGHRDTNIIISSTDTVWIRTVRLDGTNGATTACMLRGGVKVSTSAVITVRINTTTPAPNGSHIWCEGDGVYYPPY